METKEIRLRCKKGESQPIGQFLRRITMTRLPSWRPIAYQILNKTTNVLHSEGDILQDMIELSNNLSSLEFESSSKNGDYYKEDYVFTGSLMSDDLNNPRTAQELSGERGIKCVTPGVLLLSSLSDKSVTLRVIYRHGYGMFTLAQNLAFLQDKGTYNDNQKIMTSVHTVTSKFTFLTEEASLDEEDLILKLSCKTGNELSTISDALDISIDRLVELRNILGSK